MVMRKNIQEALDYIKNRTTERPGIGIILGSGLGPFAEELQHKTIIPTADIPHYPPSTVEGHAGKLVFGKVEGVKVLALQGRIHAYEGYSLKQVTFPVQLMANLGVQHLIVTNAAGGLNPNFRPGDLMIIVDHINLMFDNPLIGPNDPELGPRFPDMSEPYNRRLIELAEKTALDLGIKVQKGVLIASKGPSYETAAEVRMFQRLGGDAATMSTVPEVIVANHQSMEVLGISVITDECFPEALEPVDVEEIIRVAGRTEPKLTLIMREVVKRL